jgi:hypothetical protein
MKNIALKLGLAETASEDEITVAIALLMKRATKADVIETDAAAEQSSLGLKQVHLLIYMKFIKKSRIRRIIILYINSII